MSQETMARVVDALYAECALGNWDKVAEMVTDDLEIVEAAGLPMEGTYRGKNALRDLFTKVFGMIDIAGVDIFDRCYGEDHVVALARMNFADPSLAPAELAEAFRFRGDQVCAIIPYYFDQAPVRAAAALKAG
ncbi:nuclear transport factor 2 family protein [Croceicoccus sp. BE223]|uniref:nuclear transport factor 2 family protein n=1 Tax=Croceicoccus sp. BE223 TaxID=2817716 RepID=UPI002862FCD6|nr:nuclear transport factor 2 family protein [Croceicoccus sp. BE223]MDR7101916.1 hypothetical protein [Croceicoccus sp. BE223]